MNYKKVFIKKIKYYKNIFLKCKRYSKKMVQKDYGSW